MQTIAQHMLESLAQCIIGNGDVGHLQAGNVESLAGSHSHNAVLPAPVRDLRKHGVCAGGIDNITVDLVREHQQMVSAADLLHLRKLFLCPDTAGWIMRTAKHEQIRLWGFLFQILEILDI